MGSHFQSISMIISFALNIIGIVIILFLLPKSQKLECILAELHKLDKKIKTEKELNDIIDLKLFKHVEKCRLARYRKNDNPGEKNV